MIPSLRGKLEALAERRDELERLLSDAGVVADQERYRAYSREFAQLEPVSVALAAEARARADLAGATDRVATIDYATRLSFLAPELERRLAPLRERQQRARALSERVSDWAGFASPSLGLAQGLSILAGTDAERRTVRAELERDLYAVLPTPPPPPGQAEQAS